MRALLLSVIVTLSTLAGAGSARAATVAEADQALRTLPGLSALPATGLTLTQDGNAFTLAASNDAAKLSVLRGDGAWHGAIVFARPALFSTAQLGPELSQRLGSIASERVVLVVASAADRLPLASLPPHMQGPLADFAAAGVVSVAAGVNLFLAGTPSDDGVLGQLKGGLGMASGSVTVRGTVSLAVLVRALQAAGLAPSSVDAGNPAIDLSITLPPLTPAPFNVVGNRALLLVELERTVLTATLSPAGVGFGGQVTGRLWIAGKELGIPKATISYRRSGDTDELQLSGRAGLAIKDLFGIPGLDLKRAGLDATFRRTPTTRTGDLGVSADVVLGGKPFSGRFGAVVVKNAQGTALKEFSLALTGAIVLKDLPLFAKMPLVGEITLEDPRVGYLPDGGAYVGSRFKWPARGIDTQAVLYARKGAKPGMALFVEANQLNLKKLLGVAVIDLVMPKAVLVLSTVAMSDLPIGDLPEPVGAMLGRIGVGTGGRVSPADGVTIFTSLVPGEGNVGKALTLLGLDTPMVLAGSVGGLGGAKPSFALYADLPRMPMPGALARNQQVSLKSLQPKLFLALAWGTTAEVRLGIETEMGLNLDGRPLTLNGSLFAKIGGTAPSLEVAGKMTGEWVAPFGLAGFTLRDLAFAFGVSGDASVSIGFGGGATYDGKDFTVAAATKITFATGIPAVKGLALDLTASELSPVTAIKLAKTIFMASTGILKDAFPPATQKDVQKARDADFVAMVGPLPITRLTMRDVRLLLATPDMAIPAFPQFSDSGFAAKGSLLFDGQPMGAFDGFLSLGRGFQIKTSSARPVTVGPLQMSETLLDVGAGIPGLQAAVPRFIFDGATKVGGVPLASAKVHLAAGSEPLRVAGKVQLFDSLIAVDGQMTTDGKTYSLKGKGALNLPKAGAVNFPEADASVKLANDSGLTFSFGAKWEGLKFDCDGTYTSPKDWSLEGVANADLGSKEFKIEGVAVGKLKITSGKVKMTLSDDKAKLHFKGKGEFNPYDGGTGALPPIKLSWDEKLDADLRIRETVRFAGVTLRIDYKVFP